MKATIEWQGEVKFNASAGSGHSVLVDGPPTSGGTNAGPRPMELMLMGVGACSSYDVVHILKTGRQEVESCVAHLEAERAPEAPKVFTKMTMHFVVTGRDLSESKVARAVALSAEKYCSASIMLTRGGVEIAHSYEIAEVTA